jgi:hypothetical protein
MAGSAIVAPIARPATDRPLIAEISTMRTIVPIARPPRTPPDQTWTIR